jgi:hypothetical protein
MSAGHRESRRALALDVWRLWTDKKIDLERYIRTGSIETPKKPQLPDNPLIQRAIEEIEKRRQHGG